MASPAISKTGCRVMRFPATEEKKPATEGRSPSTEERSLIIEERSLATDGRSLTRDEERSPATEEPGQGRKPVSVEFLFPHREPFLDHF